VFLAAGPWERRSGGKLILAAGVSTVRCSHYREWLGGFRYSWRGVDRLPWAGGQERVLGHQHPLDRLGGERPAVGVHEAGGCQLLGDLAQRETARLRRLGGRYGGR
jgi:hypothetical protein